MTRADLVNRIAPSGQDVPVTRSMSKFLDAPPPGQGLTPYDRDHMALYLRLLDAARDGADWREAVQILFGLDPDLDPQRCRLIHDAHLARARWMSERGYRELVRESQRR